MYKYKPLNSGDIRVLHLEPGNSAKPLRCHIKHVSTSLNGNGGNVEPVYEAISYVWGDPSQQQLIDCTEGCLSVPTNLCDALCQLRSRGGGMVFWADSICINQSDSDEKSDQVARMGLIFSKAYHVILWQGKEDNDTKGALTALNELLDIIQDFRSENSSVVSRKRKRRLEETAARLQRKGAATPEEVEQYDLTGIHWKAMVALFQRPYFSRLWIVQEVVLAQKATIMCGSQQLEWQGAAVFEGSSADSDRALLNACVIIQKIGANAGALAKQNLGLMYNVAFMPSIVSTLDSIGDKLMAVITMNFVLGVQDLRDRFYGALHLIPELSRIEDPELRPDYSLSTEKVFHRLAIWLICKQRTFNYLIQATLQPSFANLKQNEGQETVEILPSWAPHPYREGPRVVLTERSIRSFIRPEPESKFGWAGGCSSNELLPSEQVATVSDDLMCLTMKCKLVATVDRIYRGQPQKPDTSMDDLPPEEASFDRDERRSEMAPGTVYARSLGYNAIAHLKSGLLELFPESWQERLHSEDFTIVMMALDAGLVDFNKFDYNKEILHRLNRSIAHIRAFIDEEDLTMDSSFRILRNYRILRKVHGISARRQLFRTEDGRLGLIGQAAQPGDVVAVVYGTMSPLVLRMDESGTAKLIGACTLGDFTFGAALTRDDIPTTTVTMR